MNRSLLSASAPAFGVCLFLTCLSLTADPCIAGVLFQDDFNSGVGAGWTGYDGTFSATGGALSVSSSGLYNDARVVTNAGNGSWTDYALDVDYTIRSTGDNGAGTGTGSEHPSSVLFHVENVASGCDAGQYYEFRLGPSLVGFDRINNDYANNRGATVLAETACAIGIDTTHHLRLDIIGQTATAYIDGTEVLTYDGFAEYPSGGIGLKSINSATTLFDNVVVSTTPEPATLSLIALGGLAILRRRKR